MPYNGFYGYMQASSFGQIIIPRLHLFVLLLAVMFIAIIAWPSHFYFLNDDLIHIPLAASGEIGHRNSVRYIGDYSLMLDHSLYGKSPSGYHITNLILHLLNIFLFWKILLTFILPGRVDFKNWMVLYPVMLFAFYGFHSDAIFWIIGRSASLGCLFFLLTVYCLQHSARNVLFTIGAFGFWVVALFSYESVWIFPLILLIAYFIYGSAAGKTKIIKTSWLNFIWISFGSYLIIRKLATSEWLGTYEASSFQSFNIGRLVINYFKLLARTMVPSNDDSGQFVLSAVIGFLLLAIPTAMLVIRKMYNKNWIFILACWLISYLPYLSLGISTKTIESERFLYLPSMFFSVSLIYTLYLLLKQHIKIFHIISISVIFFNTVYLIKASYIFKHNGYLVEETYSLLAENQPIQNLEIENIPHTIQGIPVFRSGFQEGYYWLVNPDKKIKIDMLDSLENSSNCLKPVIFQLEDKTQLGFKNINP